MFSVSIEMETPYHQGMMAVMQGTVTAKVKCLQSRIK